MTRHAYMLQNGCIELEAGRDFNLNDFPFLKSIVERPNNPQNHYCNVPVEKRPYLYFIAHPSIVAVMDAFEECGCRFLTQYDLNNSSRGFGIRVVMQREKS